MNNENWGGKLCLLKFILDRVFVPVISDQLVRGFNAILFLFLVWLVIKNMMSESEEKIKKKMLAKDVYLDERDHICWDFFSSSPLSYFH